jgi:hypothetical protein
MTQYKLIESGDARSAIEQLRATIKLLQQHIEILKSGGSISLDKIGPAENIAKTRKKSRKFGKGLRLADAIFQAVETNDPFTLKEALDAVIEKHQWDAPTRAIDSVRTALNNDTDKFLKIDNRYQKKK